MSGRRGPTGQAGGAVTKGGTRDSAAVALRNLDGGGGPGTETPEKRAQKEAAVCEGGQGEPGGPNEAGGWRQRRSPRRDGTQPSRQTWSRRGPGGGRPGAPRSHTAARASAATSEQGAESRQDAPMGGDAALLGQGRRGGNRRAGRDRGTPRPRSWPGKGVDVPRSALFQHRSPRPPRRR